MPHIFPFKNVKINVIVISKRVHVDVVKINLCKKDIFNFIMPSLKQKIEG